jgi:hypothetical protein
MSYLRAYINLKRELNIAQQENDQLCEELGLPKIDLARRVALYRTSRDAWVKATGDNRAEADASKLDD